MTADTAHARYQDGYCYAHGKRCPSEPVAGFQVEYTFNGRSQDRWTFDVIGPDGLICSVPAYGPSDPAPAGISARICTLLATYPEDDYASEADRVADLYYDEHEDEMREQQLEQD